MARQEAVPSHGERPGLPRAFGIGVSVVALAALGTAIRADLRVARHERDRLAQDEISRRLFAEVELSRELLQSQAARDYRARRIELLAIIHELGPCPEGEAPSEPLGGCPRAGIQVRAAAVAGLAEIEAEVRESPERWPNVNVNEETDLSHVDLRGADLRNADLEHVRLSNADLRGANLSRADLSGVSLDNARLSGVNFEGADLEGASFKGADLDGANLEYAYLMQSDLESCNLERANLTEAVLDEANLADANLRRAVGITRGQLASAKKVPTSAWQQIAE